jgi:uncharacterized protein YjiK
VIAWILCGNPGTLKVKLKILCDICSHAELSVANQFEFSGLTWEPETGSWWSISSRKGAEGEAGTMLYSFSTKKPGNVSSVQRVHVPYVKDPEGIAYLDASHFAVTDESTQAVLVFQLSNATTPVTNATILMSSPSASLVVRCCFSS